MVRWISCLVIGLAIGAPHVVRAQESPHICRVYALHELGEDPGLANWIVASIPQMIQPNSWAGTECKLRYFAPTKTLVINHTPTTHRQIHTFLQSIKINLHTPKRGIANLQQTGAQAFVAPPRPMAPKHLFHFIIRHEGDGNPVNLTLPTPAVNQQSSDPMIRMEQMLIDSDNLRQMHDEWRLFWMIDEPSKVTPYRIHGGVGPASSSI